MTDVCRNLESPNCDSKAALSVEGWGSLCAACRGLMKKRVAAGSICLSVLVSERERLREPRAARCDGDVDAGRNPTRRSPRSAMKTVFIGVLGCRCTPIRAETTPLEHVRLAVRLAVQTASDAAIPRMVSSSVRPPAH